MSKSRPVAALVVVSRHDDLLDHHLGSHEIYTPEEVPVVIVDSSPRSAYRREEEGEEPRTLVEGVGMKGWGRAAHYLPYALAAAEGEPAFYGNLVNAGCDLASELHDPEYLVLANDDTTVGPDWLETMLEDVRSVDRTPQSKKKPAGLLGARSNYCSGPQGVFDRTLEGLGLSQQTVFPYPRIVTFFAMVKAHLFRMVGGFDGDLPAHNFSDDVLSYRMLKRGGALNWVSRAFVHHAGSQTFARAEGDAEGAHRKYQADLEAGEEFVHERYPDAPMVFGSVLREWYEAQRGGGGKE